MQRSLYQQYRPKEFKDVIGQDHIVSVLENAVEKGVGHAYFFSGSRGIGKTSIARIFARALKTEDIDIFEIDAASHTSVDNIREIISSMHVQPSQSPYKIYIFDEVHMLSKSAFNALLKTLEEPPEYIVCILITTEPEKVPETIISRCVSMTFHQPSNAVLTKTILSVAEKEGYKLTDQSASLIALMAEGSFRDSLTSLQQVFISTPSKTISHKCVERLLGAPARSLINQYITSLVDGNVKNGVLALESAEGENVSMTMFGRLCLKKVRSAVLLRGGMVEILDEYDEDDTKFISDLSEAENLHFEILMDLSDALSRIKLTHTKALPLEYLLYKRQQ